MKLLTAFVFLLSTFVVQQDVEAQTRGPSYNPRPSGGSSSRTTPSRPSSGGSSNRGPSYNPSPSRPSTSPSHSPAPSRPTASRPSPSSGESSNRGPSYNPSPSRPSTSPSRPSGPSYNPRPNGPVVTRPAPQGPNYNPRPNDPRPTPPRYNPTPGHNGPVVVRRTVNRPAHTYYGTRDYHRPIGYTPIRYSHYYHAPYRSPYYHSVRYYRSYDWYSYVFRTHPTYVYAHWIFYPATGYRNGYSTIDNYPYYVYNGYRHRYSSNDYCNYQLVDSNNHQVIQTYWNQLCNTGYDACSVERDRINAQMNDYRYFCSETFRDHGYDYSKPTYEIPEYSQDNTCTDANRDGMCDDYVSDTCIDNDYNGYCDTATN